jgi:aspartyl-tRNA synthetase
VDFPCLKRNWRTAITRPVTICLPRPSGSISRCWTLTPAQVLSEQYDLVCNGYEVAGGSIRIHERPLQRKIMELIGFSWEQAEDQFGHMLEAFEYGAPPARRHRPRH